jgi:cytochrome b561
MTAATSHLRPEDTASREAPARYHTDQMALHWLVVALVLFQFATGWSMEAAMDVAYLTGVNVTDGVVFVHGIIGSSILVAMLARLYLRFHHGVPTPPTTEPRPLQWLSRGVHYAFYLVLIAMPIFGIAAVVTLIPWLGAAHGWAALALAGLAALHVAGATWHLIKGDGVVRRIISSDPPRLHGDSHDAF